MAWQKDLLRWFAKNQRPLPWRRHTRPYEVWVSEIMLQQTQVETMLPYFRRWMRLFPTIAALAKSPEKKVLKAWEGLGYYSRARNLHETAKRIVREHGGAFPRDFETILSLKGIGRYSAGAIASIAFNEPRPIVDGNVFRVLSRLYAIKKPIDIPRNREIFWKLEADLIPPNRARLFNQALMELGALVCAAKNPACALCPLQKHCLAFKNDDPEAYPVREKKKKMVKIIAAAVVISRRGDPTGRPHYLVQQRPLGEIMGGLWEFPEWKLAKDTALDPEKIKHLTLRRVLSDFGMESNGLKEMGRIKRNYTHHLETLHVFGVPAHGRGNPAPTGGWPFAWVTPEKFADYPFSSAHAKIANMIPLTPPVATATTSPC
ncbi:MAG: A/G-specific adenine glycosylase [Candidatus Omnitrophica bacterium]|nr:A/G-specific adenine glycosylase [Candidatus Omnitrophota bacterium]